MKDIKFSRKCAALAILTAGSTLAACGGDGHSGGAAATTPPAAAITPTVFSTFTNSTYAQGPATMPIDLTSLTFTFDVNNDPTAFDGLLM